MELDGIIQEEREKLRSLHGALQRCEVTIDDRPPRRYECKRYHVRLEIDIHGRHLVVNREHDDDPRIALGEAFAAARSSLGEPPRRR